MASKVRYLLLVAAVTPVALLWPLDLGGCARRAYADEYVVSDDYATRSDVSRLDGSVSALTGSVSSGLSNMQDDVSNIGRDVSTLVEGASGDSENIESAKDSAQKAAEGVQAANDALDLQGQKLDSLGDAVSELTQASREGSGSEVSQMNTDDLLALVPSGASDEIAEYMQYPFLMGMASGTIAYIISLIVAAVYRLLGFK